MKNILLVMASFAFILTSAAQPGVRQKIEELNKAMEKSFSENDMMQIASFYADSALISAGGRMNVQGRSAIDRYWNSMKDRGGSWKLEIDSIEEFGQYVLQRGRSYLQTKAMDGSAREINVRFYIIWLKTGDSYKIINDIYTRL